MRVGGRFEEERAQGAGAVRDRGAPDRTVEAYRAPRVEVERERFGEAERCGDGREFPERSCAGEERGSGSERGHAARCGGALAGSSSVPRKANQKPAVCATTTP